MSMQAQIREWAEDAVRAVLGPVLSRIEKIENYILDLEQADQVPPDRPADRPVATKPSAAASRTSSNDRPARSAAPRSGQKGPAGK